MILFARHLLSAENEWGFVYNFFAAAFLENLFDNAVKVACVVNLKLAFTDWFFHNFVILIKSYKIRYLNLDKALLFPRNQAICLRNWKLWRAPTNVKFNIFSWNFAHVSYLMISEKGCSRFFYFVNRSKKN